MIRGTRRGREVARPIHPHAATARLPRSAGNRGSQNGNWNYGGTARRILDLASDLDSWHRVLSDERQSGPKRATFRPIRFFSSLEILASRANQAPIGGKRCLPPALMQAPAQSSQLLPGPFVFSRLCSALTLAGLAFYACAPELIAPELAPLPAQRQTACSWFCYSPRPLPYA